jgi:hypothetical protein
VPKITHNNVNFLENPLRDNSGSRKNRKIDGDAPGQKLGSQVHKITFCWRKFMEKKLKIL